MSFDYASLITDRAVSDSDTLKALLGKPLADWTEAERTAFNSAMLKGSYDYTDLNRVDACLEDLVARLGRMGYAVPGYQRVKLPRETKPASRLPKGYTEVQYIRSTGTQYVDTGFFANQDSRLVIDFDILSQSSLDYIFGARSANNTKMFELAVQGSTWYSGFGNANTQPQFSGLGHYIVDKNKNVTTINGNTSTATQNAFVTAYSVKLFALDNVGTIGFFAVMKLRSCQIYDNGTLIRDYLPCINASGAAGLYDLVSGKFYGNSGTGVFLAGPRKVTLPEGYTQVEYIQSNGGQYINSGIIGNQKTRIDADYSTTATVGAIIGADKSWGSNMCTLEVHFSAFGSSNYSYSAVPSGRHFVSLNQGALSLDGSLLTTMTGTFETPVNMTIFALNRNGAVQEYGTITLYSLNSYNDGEIIRCYVPCTNASGAAGLYDLVGQEFYGNAGTGSFTAGEAVTWPEEPDTPSDDLDPYTWYESDVPTVPLLAQYRGNVAAVRAVLQLPEGTPEPPGTMAQLTTAGANSIEAVLLAVDLILNHIPAAVRHCGVTVCGSKGVMA